MIASFMIEVSLCSVNIITILSFIKGESVLLYKKEQLLASRLSRLNN